MRQGKTPTRDFARKFERRARDAEMGAKASKVHLVAALNEDTLQNLDAYVTLQGGEEMTRLETMPDRLRCITNAQMLTYLKQSNLTDLAKWGAGHTVPEERQRTGATNQVGYGFFNAGIMMVASRRSSSAKRNRIRGRGSVQRSMGRRCYAVANPAVYTLRWSARGGTWTMG